MPFSFSFLLKKITLAVAAVAQENKIASQLNANRSRTLYCSFDLDLDTMTFIYELDL